MPSLGRDHTDADDPGGLHLAACTGQIPELLKLKETLQNRLGVTDITVGLVNGTHHLTVDIPDQAAADMSEEQIATRAREIATLAYTLCGRRSELQQVTASLMYRKQGSGLLTARSAGSTFGVEELKDR